MNFCQFSQIEKDEIPSQQTLCLICYPAILCKELRVDHRKMFRLNLFILDYVTLYFQTNIFVRYISDYVQYYLEKQHTYSCYHMN